MPDIKKYGETSTEKWAREKMKSREIVAEIMKFGVNQNQILQIINLLSLEIEDRNTMLCFVNAYKSLQEDTKLEGSENTHSIILDS
jgi:hypothetical protein